MTDDNVKRFGWSDGEFHFENTLCDVCKHRLKGQRCKAFPNGIPNEIFTEKVYHTKHYPGDNGIQFEPSD